MFVVVRRDDLTCANRSSPFALDRRICFRNVEVGGSSPLTSVGMHGEGCVTESDLLGLDIRYRIERDNRRVRKMSQEVYS